MDIRSEILDYINRNETTGALLLTGSWGCGKSYLVKDIAREQNDKKKAAVAVISLFGLDSVDAINKRVKDEYIGFLLGVVGKTAKKISKAVGTVSKDGMSVASIAADGNPGLSAAAQGLSAVMTYDFFSLISVKNSLGSGNKERKFIIVFDDLERNNIPKKDLLGAINEYVENKQIKVIIVADQDKIAGNEYKEYKEKLISRTIKMTADYSVMIDGIIDKYCETSKGYREFLTDHKSQLKQVFIESKSNNLRTLKSAIADFERFYDAWKETEISTDNMKWALYTFAAEVFASKVPPKEEPAENRRNSWFVLDRKDEQYTDKGKNKSSFSAFGTWLHSGIWNKDAFVRELKEKYAESDDNPLERFLYYNFWSLEQRDIDEGIPAALTLAYEGRLTSTDLISLIVKVYYLQSFSIELPCVVDYEKIEAGYRSRIIQLKNGEVSEPKRHTFATRDQIDPQAYELYKLIERLDDVMAAWENRKTFIAYLSGESSRLGLKGLYLEEFDDELLAVFKARYSQANNADKEDYASTLLGLVFDFNTYSSEENISKTIHSFEDLSDWLNSSPCNDAITTLINKSFAEKIAQQEIMSRYKEKE